MIPWIYSISKPGLTLGNARDLPCDHAEHVLTSQVEKITNILKLKCFNYYATIFDETSLFAPVEAIVTRAIKKQYRIIQVLGRVGLFQKSLNAEAIDNHLLQTLSLKIGLELKDWVVTMKDRATTDGAALREITSRTLHARPSKADCMSHTLNNTANEMIGKTRAPYCDLFWRLFQAII